MHLLLATRNPHKMIEIRLILSRVPVTLHGLDEFPGFQDVEEDGATLLENAVKKARAAFRYTGWPSLGDDSGLEVDALDGEPGVRSARYSGVPHDAEKNMDKLIAALRDVRPERRTARFRCVLALEGYERDGATSHTFEGCCDGLIIDERKGRHGFGYDPIFWIPEYGRTFAELGPEIKNRISHRARALAEFRTFLERGLEVQRV